MIFEGSQIVPGWMSTNRIRDERVLESVFEALKVAGAVVWVKLWESPQEEKNVWGEPKGERKAYSLAFVKVATYDEETRMPIGKYQGMDLVLQTTNKALLDRGVVVWGKTASGFNIEYNGDIFDVKAIVPLMDGLVVEFRCRRSGKVGEGEGG